MAGTKPKLTPETIRRDTARVAASFKRLKCLTAERPLVDFRNKLMRLKPGLSNKFDSIGARLARACENPKTPRPLAFAAIRGLVTLEADDWISCVCGHPYTPFPVAMNGVKALGKLKREERLSSIGYSPNKKLANAALKEKRKLLRTNRSRDDVRRIEKELNAVIKRLISAGFE